MSSERDEIAALRADLVAVLAGVILHADPYRAVARRYADAILASDWLAERDRRTAAKARPEVLRERVEYETRSEWRGCRCGHPGAGCYCTSVTVRTGRKRTITEFKPVVSEWTDQ